jgi:translation initiation factor IF-2
VRAVFPVGRGAIAGCYILSGKVSRNSKIRIRRGNNVVHESSLDSLMRMKEKVSEVNAGYECGIGIDSFKDWVVGDIIEVFKLVSKRRTLSV